ncbi:MAG: radical SAM protein, partial [candidate division WOR-3 bacterium]
MPAFGVKFMDWEKVLTSREILRLAKIFKELGISKVRLTGGEPLLRWDLREIVEGLKELNLSLNITTNGILLDNYLDFLKDKVDYLYKALEKGFKMVKINTVIANGF